MFVGEVLVVAVILLLARRVADAAPEKRARFDLVGAVLVAVGLGFAFRGAALLGLGWVTRKPDGPSWLDMSPTIWLILMGLLVVWLFVEWSPGCRRGGGNPWCDGTCSATTR